VEPAIDRLEQAIALGFPSIKHLYLESGALKSMTRPPPPGGKSGEGVADPAKPTAA
jgi:hypothetical protein